VNVWGVREAAVLQLVTTVLKILPLVAVGFLGVMTVHVSNLRAFNVSAHSTVSAVTATAALTLWGFLGLECATIPAEQVRNPERTIPLATVLGTVATAGLYLLSAFVVMGTLPVAELAASPAPYADAATRIWGPWTGKAVAAGAALAGFGVLNGWVLMQGQMPLAPARDGLFPEAFGRLSRRGTPVFGLVLSSALATVLVAANYTRGLVGLFTFAVLLATVTVLASYVCSAAAQILLIVREPGRWGGRGARRALVVSALALVYSLWAVVGAGWDAVFWGGVLFLLGFPVYLQGRRGADAVDTAGVASEPADA
jgi:APA family basic amino acid/polyamine antiporter